MLAADPDNLTDHDIASGATWADRYPDRNESRQHYEQTWGWHFVNVEPADPSLDTACYGHPSLPTTTVTSNGPSQACIANQRRPLSIVKVRGHRIPLPLRSEFLMGVEATAQEWFSRHVGFGIQT
jgi:hypothetical protein